MVGSQAPANTSRKAPLSLCWCLSKNNPRFGPADLRVKVRGAEPNIDKKAQRFRSPFGFSLTMRGACSTQVQAQNKHSRGLKTGSALALQGAFADTNIAKG